MFADRPCAAPAAAKFVLRSLRGLIVLIAAAIAPLDGMKPAAAADDFAPPRRPNIILLITDDQG